MSQSQSGAAAVAMPRPVFAYDGRVLELFGIFLLNLLLTIITFGIFRFWAITRMRRYLWSHMRFQDTRFTYTGKGKEIFLGFCLAMLILGLLSAGVGVIAGGLAMIEPGLAVVAIVLIYPLMFVLFGAAHFSAQRYRLSRTEWRGIRGGMEGSAIRYGFVWMLFLFASIVTLYQAVPWMQVGLARRRIDASRFGSASFKCEARGGGLWPLWFVTIAGSFVLLGLAIGAVFALEWSALKPVFDETVTGPRASARIARAMPVVVVALLLYILLSGLLTTWYFARLARQIVDRTSVILPGAASNPRFHSSITAPGLLWLYVSNGLIGLLTLGFGLPVVLHRSMRFLTRNLHLMGDVDTTVLTQSTLPRPGVGEGMLQALDPGVF